jgi:hypothetical protein
MFAALALAALTPHPFPEAAAEAICQTYIRAPHRDQAGFWKRADVEFGLDDRQRVEVRVFCLGYQRALVAAARKAAVRR